MFSTQRLHTLREFALRGTVAATAHSLGHTPSAVSQQLAALEAEAGAKLLRRSGRRLLLTPAGERLAHAAEEILAAIEQAETQLRASMSIPVGSVRLALFQSAALTLLPNMLAHLGDHAPGVRLHVTQSEPAQALEDTWARDYDVVVAEEYPHHSAPHYPDLRRETLIQDEIALAAPATPGSAAPGQSLKDFAASAWVMEPRGTASRHFAEQTCRVAGFEPDVRYETADLQAHVALVKAGAAVTFLPGLMWMDPPAGLRRIALANGPRRTVFAALRATTAVDPTITATLAALHVAAATVGAGDLVS